RSTREKVAAQVAAVPVCERQTLASLSKATRIPTTTLWRYVKIGWLRRAVSHVKPALSDAHKFRRLILYDARPSHIGSSYRMQHMYGVVYIVEVWFNLYKGTAIYYLTPDEGLPYRSTPKPRYIGMVIFLAAIARPRFNVRAKKSFDGNNGIWPIVERSLAQKS
ncbi:hypothetical protein JG687_00006835, partial [Phytophthora cactorum]